MTATQTPQRLRLGRELRAWRERRGIEAAAVARALVCSPTKMSRIESGQASVSGLELQTLLRMYEVPEGEQTERIEAIAEAARQRSTRYRVAPWVRAYVGFEAEATEIQDFQIDMIPGLLQTEAYARVVASAGATPRPATEVERSVRIRQQRQARLLDANPPTLTTVIHEAALRMEMGGSAVMREQLAHLLKMTEQPHIDVRVLPFSAGAHTALGSGFTILRLPEPADAQVVYLEDLWSADYVNREDQVAAYTLVFDRLCTQALDQQGSVAMIKKAVGDKR